MQVFGGLVLGCVKTEFSEKRLIFSIVKIYTTLFCNVLLMFVLFSKMRRSCPEYFEKSLNIVTIVHGIARRSVDSRDSSNFVEIVRELCSKPGIYFADLVSILSLSSLEEVSLFCAAML